MKLTTWEETSSFKLGHELHPQKQCPAIIIGIEIIINWRGLLLLVESCKVYVVVDGHPLIFATIFTFWSIFYWFYSQKTNWISGNGIKYWLCFMVKVQIIALIFVRAFLRHKRISLQQLYMKIVVRCHENEGRHF